MSTFNEIAKTKTTIYLRPREGFLLSVSRDIVTLAVVCLCVYVSKDSSWWTLVTGLMFIFFVYAKFTSALGRNATTFETKEAAIEYLNKTEI